ncbi:RND superfamily putative drug exporter [Nocardioides aromaticivorans]|uniref:RND superfamily putative drug exporter n=1 Tax=Nocardioides aromaticivorans TaxID=200618 RepID=A0A7Y9ZIW6_9ACTN|nr:MMPL family transporter [Nocardioides aromaticivorans]NYI44770.1 RND superfamily putative drug exporter [Nocardioides aromaticivorans]
MSPSTRRPSRVLPTVAPRAAWLVALAPLLLALLALGLLGEGEREQRPTDSLPRGLDSTLAAELDAQVGDDGQDVAIVLFTSDGDELAGAGRSVLDGAVRAVGAVPRSLTVAEDGSAAFVVVPVTAASATDTVDRVDELRAVLAEQVPEGVTAQVTGPAGVQADLAKVFDGANTRLLLATASVVTILLVLTYRSPVLWLVPLLVVGIADRLAAVLATQAMAALDVAWNESTVGILSVLVFGAGTNYALLLISRYRDELGSHASRHEAMSLALRRTVEPVLASATTVVLGLLTLLLSLTPSTRGLGLACAIGIIVAASFVLVVLPALLVLFGRWVFWPRVPREGATPLAERTSLWRRVGGVVQRRPAVLVGTTTAVLALLAIGLLRVETGLGRADQFLEEPEAIAAGERLAESFPAGTSSPTEVLTRADADDVLRAVEDSAAVVSARVAGAGGGVTRIDVVLDAEPGTAAARSAVGSLRDALSGFDDTHVGGEEAVALDEREGAGRDRWVVLPLILGVVLLALVLLLRSAVAPLLLVATVLATYAASMGASWWLFTGPLGFEALDVQVPLFAFLFLVALGVDYNIFLVTRAREEAREHGTRDGMLRALAATGGVITSAGILLGAVFAVLGVLPLVVLAQLGVVVCLGVLLDTLVVRTVLVPALAMLLGERFWWPARVSASAGRGVQ